MSLILKLFILFLSFLFSLLLFIWRISLFLILFCHIFIILIHSYVSLVFLVSLSSCCMSMYLLFFVGLFVSLFILCHWYFTVIWLFDYLVLFHCGWFFKAYINYFSHDVFPDYFIPFLMFQLYLMVGCQRCCHYGWFFNILSLMLMISKQLLLSLFFCCFHWYIDLSIAIRPPWPPSMLNIGWWFSMPRE